MNVLHLVSGELTGGAAKGAYWLHRALLENGTNSRILNKAPSSFPGKNVDHIRSTLLSIVREKVDRLPLALYPSRQETIFDTGLLGVRFRKTDAYRWADLIHLHWINNGFVDIKSISKIDKPIVWTMRDMWPMTGGCHVAMDCDRYKRGCGSCPQLNSASTKDLSRLIVYLKRKFVPTKTVLVGISSWLSKCAGSSYLYRDFDIRTIHNGIDLAQFGPVDKGVARHVLGLRSDKPIVLAGAQHIDVYHKGWDKFVAAASRLTRDVQVVLFGNIRPQALAQLRTPPQYLGFLRDELSLKLAYSAADVFVAPSMMDAFGKTLAESLACGTPVVCFRATGPADIVDHKVTGYSAQPFDESDLAAGVEWVLEDKARWDRLSVAARKTAEAKFDIRFIARQYSELYHDLVSEVG